MTDAASTPSGPPVPETLGEFAIRGVLGQGGSGIVYDATWGPRRVALKVLHPALVSTERERAQFLAEARRLLEITHPGVVKVFAVGELDGRPYLAMERLDGQTLAGLLRDGALAPPRALALFGQLCAAVGALHGQGLIHRDLKPENIFVVPAPDRGGDDGAEHAVLLDFGIAKELAAPASTTTVDGGVRGTPAYMAPERFFGQPAAISTDVYELAVTLYAMLAGRLPWDDLGDPEARLAPRSLDGVAGVGSELDVELRRALSTRAANRPATVAALREVIFGAAGLGGGASRSPSAIAVVTAPLRGGASSAPTVTPAGPAWFDAPKPATDPGRAPLAWAPTVRPDVTPVAPTPRRSRRRSIALAAGGLAIAGAAVGVALRWPRDTATSATPTAATRPPMLPAASDPWQATVVDASPRDAPPALPLATAAPDTAALRADLAAALRHVPAASRIVILADLDALRGSPTIARTIAAAADDPRLRVLLSVGPPCLKELLASSDWAVYAAPSVDEAIHGSLQLHGRWRRADVIACVGDAARERLPQPDGGEVLRLSDDGWLDFIDDHTALLVGRAKDAVAVHKLTTTLAGPTGRTAALLAELPPDRAVGFAVDAPDDHTFEGGALPQGTDLVGWFRPDGDGLALDVGAALKTEGLAATAEAAVRKALASALGEHPTPALGSLEVARDHATVHVRGRLSSLVLGMVENSLRGR